MRDQLAFTYNKAISVILTSLSIILFPYNQSTHPWEHMKKHIQDILHSNITLDLEALQKESVVYVSTKPDFDEQIQDWGKFTDTFNELNTWNYLKVHFGFHTSCLHQQVYAFYLYF